MAEAPMRVTVTYSPASREVFEWLLVLRTGATVGEALVGTQLEQQFPGVVGPDVQLGVWGRKCEPWQPLQDGDRVEVYRALKVDPKVARRERFRGQGSRAAGLFARKG